MKKEEHRPNMCSKFGCCIICEDCPFFEDCLLGRRNTCEWRDILNREVNTCL